MRSRATSLGGFFHAGYGRIQVRQARTSSFSTGCGEDLVERVVSFTRGRQKTFGGPLPRHCRLTRGRRDFHPQFRTQPPNVIANGIEMIGPQRAQKVKVTLAQFGFARNREPLGEMVQRMRTGKQS
ncbi:MAG TPA: hypothetical protein VES20_02710, partial [Bryobacteraceae bacterium]|nr:hypothetical protein [Bryobacteraceae bacterium]